MLKNYTKSRQRDGRRHLGRSLNYAAGLAFVEIIMRPLLSLAAGKTTARRFVHQLNILIARIKYLFNDISTPNFKKPYFRTIRRDFRKILRESMCKNGKRENKKHVIDRRPSLGSSKQWPGKVEEILKRISALLAKCVHQQIRRHRASSIERHGGMGAERGPLTFASRTDAS